MNTVPALSLWKLLVLCVLFLVPGASLAAQEPSSQEPPPIPGTQALDSRHLAEDYGGYDDYGEERNVRTPGLGLRILAESGLGLVTSLGLGFGGALAGGGICTAFKLERDYLACLNYTFIGYVVPAFAGIALGVWAGGEIAGGDGRFLPTLLGTSLGLLVSVGLGVLVRPQQFEQSLLIALAPPLLGSIAFYELFQRDRTALAPASLASRSRVQPTVTVSSRGAGLGLVGRF
jgi:hypothetical protein